MSGRDLRVGVVGCGLMGGKRAATLDKDLLVACHDIDRGAAETLAAKFGAQAYDDLDELLEQPLDALVVATTHDALAETACRALERGLDVLVEKPVGTSLADVERVAEAAERARRLAWAGFNHRFHPGIERLTMEVRSGRFGSPLFVRGLYGHGGRLGYEGEWRASRALAGGGELVDQGMHLVDLSNWLLGPLPVRSAFLRRSYWDMEVEDNAVLVLGEEDETAPWALLHASWTEWKNSFSLEVYCRTGKLHLQGLAGSYGPQRLRIYSLRPELGPPEEEEVAYPPGDVSFSREWKAFRTAAAGGARDNLDSALYAWSCVEAAYAQSGA